MAAKGITNDDVADPQFRDGGISSEFFHRHVQLGYLLFILRKPKEREYMLNDIRRGAPRAYKAKLNKDLKNLRQMLSYHEKTGKPLKRFQ